MLDSHTANPFAIPSSDIGAPALPSTPAIDALTPPAAVPRSAVATVIGGLLLLAACCTPLLAPGFVPEHVAPAVLQVSPEAVETALQPRRSVPSTALAETLGVSRSGIDPGEVSAARATLGPLLRAEQDGGVDVTEMATFLWSALESGPTTRDHADGAALLARSLLAGLILLLAVGLLCTLYALIRKLAPLDALQVSAQGAFGAVLLCGFGLIALAALVDPRVAAQVRTPGVVLGLSGSALIWGSAVASLQGRSFVRVSALGVALLCGVAAAGYLLVTL